MVQTSIDYIKISSSPMADSFQFPRIVKYRDYMIVSWLNWEDYQYDRIYTKKYSLTENSGIEIAKETSEDDAWVKDYLIVKNEADEGLEIVTEEALFSYGVYGLKRSDYKLPIMRIIMNDELSWYKNGTFTVKVIDGNGMNSAM